MAYPSAMMPQAAFSMPQVPAATVAATVAPAGVTVAATVAPAGATVAPAGATVAATVAPGATLAPAVGATTAAPASFINPDDADALGVEHRLSFASLLCVIL